MGDYRPNVYSQTPKVSFGKSSLASLLHLGLIPQQLVTTPSLQAVLDTNPCLIVWNHLLSTYDPRYGGFSQQGNNATGPKFPSSSMTLEVLTRYSIQSPAPDDEDVRAEAREMGLKTLRAMWYGGIRDWVGHGFARYTADEKWFVPHFEKML